jgi:hypothetical protein
LGFYVTSVVLCFDPPKWCFCLTSVVLPI